MADYEKEIIEAARIANEAVSIVDYFESGTAQELFKFIFSETLKLIASTRKAADGRAD
jgi:hypothetical protein